MELKSVHDSTMDSGRRQRLSSPELMLSGGSGHDSSRRAAMGGGLYGEELDGRWWCTFKALVLKDSSVEKAPRGGEPKRRGRERKHRRRDGSSRAAGGAWRGGSGGALEVGDKNDLGQMGRLRPSRPDALRDQFWKKK
jgi:hypothetical protein